MIWQRNYAPSLFLLPILILILLQLAYHSTIVSAVHVAAVPPVVGGALISFLVATATPTFPTFPTTPPQSQSQSQSQAEAEAEADATQVILSNKYNEYSSTYDQLDGGSSASANAFGVLELRQQASKSVNGDVLEVAIGTGLQSEFYNAKNIKSFTGIDLSEGMLKAAKQKLSNTLSTVQSRQLEVMDAQELSFKDESFDTVIDTFSMCVIPNPDIAIQEMARVVKSGGNVILLENARSDNTIMGLFQDIMEPLVTPISKDCKWNVDVEALANKHSLRLVNSERKSLGTLQLGIYTK